MKYENTLKQYVHDTILERLPEYSCAYGDDEIDEAMRSLFKAAIEGINTGWWTDLIRIVDCLALHGHHLAAIRQALVEYPHALSEVFGHDHYSIAEFMEANAKAWTLQEYTQDAFRLPRPVDCALWSLRFAVECYAREVAHDLGVEL